MVERATHGNRSLLESVLDNLDRSDIKHEDIIQSREPALDYDTMFLFNVYEGNSEVDYPLTRIAGLAEAMGIDVYMEGFCEEDFEEAEYIDHS